MSMTRVVGYTILLRC